MAAGSSMVRSMVERPGRGRRWRGRGGHWEVAGGPGPPGWVRAAAAALAHSATGQARPPSGAPVAGGGAVGTGAGCSARWLHPRLAAVLGWVRDHGGWSSPSLTPGWAAPEGQGRCRRGWACGPSAAQAGSERPRLAAGSAVTCDDGWWACQDLNLGPHPYQVSRPQRCADRRFPRSPASIRAKGCVLSDLVPSDASKAQAASCASSDSRIRRASN